VKAVEDPVGVGSASPGDRDERLLLAAARRGDRAALETLCRSSWKPVFRSLARYTDDPAEAEDLTQEVFVRALRALPRFVDRGVPFTAYLLHIADNLTRDRWRRGPSKVESLERLVDHPSDGPPPEHGLLQGDRREALLRGLDQLTLDQRTVLRMRFLEGRTTREIATLTKRNVAAVRQVQARGLHALRATLGEEWNQDAPRQKGLNDE
jgi:RNA polymerase sigma-70 factor, ECF subfamily